MKKNLNLLGIVIDFIVSVSYVSLYLLYNNAKNDKLFDYLPYELSGEILKQLAFYSPFILLLSVVLKFFKNSNFIDFFRDHIHTILILLPLYLVRGDLGFVYWLFLFHLISSVFFRYVNNREDRLVKKPQFQIGIWERLKLNPPQLVILSFIGLILLGTGILLLPFIKKDGFDLSFIDAFFMATSATCVTGLATFSIGENFTLIGQLFILFLIQIGGLGIMTLTSSMTILLGKTFGMKEQVFMKGLLDISSLEELIEMIFEIIKLTLSIEFIGAILLSAAFIYEGQDIGEAMFNGLFHSVSAFCNAGFALFSDSLVEYKSNYFVNFVIMGLILLGGLGFFVMKDIKQNFLKKRKWVNLSLHSKIVIYTNVALVFLGTFAFFFSEFLNSIDEYSLPEKFLISLFQSVTTRTAGFNSLDFSSFHSHTIYFMAILMFIGASPGSTGGGLKTTTFAILIQSVRATLQGRSEIEFFDKKIPNSLYVRSVALLMISLGVLTTFILIMVKLEPNLPFLSVLFETISAFGTVGLSLGITADLGSTSKFFIILLMFIGRVGPFTLVLALSQLKTLPSKVQYAEGRVMIG